MVGVEAFKRALYAMEERIAELRKKIIEGLTLSAKRLIEAKAKEDGVLIYSERGKIVRVKARKLLAERK